nr:hypothetical protein [Tanacetum cinerariifolium]
MTESPLVDSGLAVLMSNIDWDELIQIEMVETVVEAEDCCMKTDKCQNDELTKKELKQIEGDDQAIQTILLGLLEDIYAAVDSCETAHEIWFTSSDGESIESYYHHFLKLTNDLKRNKHFQEKIAKSIDIEYSTDKAPVYDSDGSAEYIEVLEPIPEPHQVPQNDNIDISKDSSVEHSGGTVEQHPANVKETPKFVGDFKSLENEADESLAKHKTLELEIERLLRVVVSQDIMFVVQNNFVVDKSNLQTELERDDLRLTVLLGGEGDLVTTFLAGSASDSSSESETQSSMIGAEGLLD